MVLVDPTTNGASRAQVVLEGSMATSASGASNFRGDTGVGNAKVTDAKKLAGRTHTLLVFDQSGSFRTHWERAFNEANAFADALPPDHTVEVATFGTGYTVHGKADSPTALKALLATARSNGPKDKTTRMHSLVKEGINQVAKALPPTQDGLRQVVVFSDLDEEGTFTPAMAIDAARAQGVRVHLVYFASESATHTDNAQRLAESTGGLLVNATGGASPRAKLVDIATAGKRTWWLTLGFCDVPAGSGASFDDQLKVEVWGGSSRLGSSQAFPFRSGADAVSSKPCAPVAVPEPAAPPPAAAPSPGIPAWMLALGACLPLSLLALLALPFLFAALTRKKPEAPKPAAAPVVEDDDHLEGSVAPEVFKPVAVGILARLPPTRLVKVSGPAHLPTTLELRQREQTLGAKSHNTVLLDGDTVSGEHCSFELFPDGDLWVRDHDATNGTWVDGKRLTSGERRLLRPGSQVGFGQHLVYRVEQDNAFDKAASVPPPAAPPEPAPPPASRKTTFRPVKGPKS